MRKLLALALLLGAAPQEEDLLTQVLRDETARTVKRLRMEQMDGPYYVAYTVNENQTFSVSAVFGALTGQGGGKSRGLSIDLRVGSYALDNTNFSGGGWGGGGGGSLTVDDSYDALRHEVWLETDASYKSALEELEKKKAFLSTNPVKDRPDDWSREDPRVHVESLVKLEVDKDAWAKRVKRLSAVFRDYPAVQNSQVSYNAAAQNRWFLNSEGFRTRTGQTGVQLLITAVAQAEDGMKFADYEYFVGRSDKDLPSEKDIEKAARDLAERLTKICSAPLMEEYRGPVLFEGQAAAEFFAQTLIANLGNAHETVGNTDPTAAVTGNQLRQKIGLRVMPKFLTVVDDPGAREYRGTPLLSSYEVDHDGVKAQRITLVEKGMLRTFCMGRIPTRAIKKSNGHARNGAGATSTLFIQSESRLGAKALRERLYEFGRDEGLKHVYIVRRVSNSLSSSLDQGSWMAMVMRRWSGQAGDVTLMPPILIYRVSVEDGKEELVRGARFGKMTLRVLRDIAATGEDERAYPVVADSDNEIVTVVTPSLLFAEMEINRPGEEREKTPALKNPYFDK